MTSDDNHDAYGHVVLKDCIVTDMASGENVDAVSDLRWALRAGVDLGAIADDTAFANDDA